MTIEIQFIEGIKEEILPLVKLTKSKNGQTGTATFIFIEPKSLEFCTTKPIVGMLLLTNDKKIVTNDVSLCFKFGKIFFLKAIIIFKNPKEWFEFLSFMNLYSKETGLSFSEKKF